MAGSGTGCGFEADGVVWADDGGSGVELIDEGGVESEVGDEEVFVGFVEVDAVGVGAVLALGVGAFSLVEDDAGGFAGESVLVEGDGDDAAIAVVGDGEGFSGGIDDEVAGAASAA